MVADADEVEVRPSFAIVGALAVLAAGIGFSMLRGGAEEGPYESALPITMADPLPDGSAVATVTGVGDPPLSAAPDTVIELTYAGVAASGHAPCATLEVLTDGDWRATHSLASAFGPPGSPDPDPTRFSFGAETTDTPVTDEDGRLIVTTDEWEGVLVCPAVDLIGEGPERFRLPLKAPDGPARLCLNQSAPCFLLDYAGEAAR